MASLVAYLFGDWLGVCLTLGAFLVTWWLWAAVKRRTMPPGPRPLPLLGNYLQIMRQPDYAYEYFRKLGDKYGALVTLQVGPMPFVVVNFLEGFKQTLVKYQNEFAGRPDLASVELFTAGESSIAFGQFGPAWSFHRRLAMTAMKSYASRDTLTQLTHEEVREGVDQLLSAAAVSNGATHTASVSEGGSSSSSEGPAVAIDLYDTVYSILYGSMSRIVFGGDMPREEKQWLMREMRILNESFGAGFYQDFLPVWLGKHVPSPGLMRMKRRLREIMDVVAAKLQRHKDLLDRDNIRDLTDAILVAAAEARERGEDVTMLSDRMILNTVSDVFFNATDTTAYTSLWTFLYLASYPDVQEKMRASIHLVAKDRDITLEDRTSMPYVEAVINEVLRLRPIAPLSLGHTTTCDVTVEGFGKTPTCRIPRGTNVFPNIWSCQHDPATWGPDVAEFRPERFLSPDGSKFVKHDGLVPFSLGRRQCLGEQLARQNLFLIIGGIIQRLKIKSDGNLPSTQPSPVGGPFFAMPHRFKVVVEKV